MRSSAVAVQISRSGALEATLSSSEENSDLNVIGKFPISAPCICETEKLICQVVMPICKFDNVGWFGAAESAKEGSETGLGIYSY